MSKRTGDESLLDSNGLIGFNTNLVTADAHTSSMYLEMLKKKFKVERVHPLTKVARMCKWLCQVFHFITQGAICDEYDEGLLVFTSCRDLDLKRPIYQKTACYGHFGRPEFSWEQPKILHY